MAHNFTFESSLAYAIHKIIYEKVYHILNRPWYHFIFSTIKTSEGSNFSQIVSAVINCQRNADACNRHVFFIDLVY